jgi:hypothetical protein
LAELGDSSLGAYGMLGYLLGKVVNFSGQIAFVFAVMLLVGALLFTGLAIGSPGGGICEPDGW